MSNARTSSSGIRRRVATEIVANSAGPDAADENVANVSEATAAAKGRDLRNATSTKAIAPSVRSSGIRHRDSVQKM